MNANQKLQIIAFETTPDVHLIKPFK